MTFTQMAWLDRWIGMPACGALTVLRRIQDVLFSSRRKPRPPQKILFIKLIEQGATVLASAAIRRAIELVGRENVYFLVFEENRPILDLMELLPPENVIVLRSSGMLSFVRDLVRGLWQIRRLNIDSTLDFELFSRISAIISFLSGASIRVGLHRFTSEGPYRGDLMTHRVQYNPYLHASEAYRILAETLLSDPSETPLFKAPRPSAAYEPPPFRPAATQLAFMQSLLGATANDSSRHFIVVNANTSDQLPLRRWLSSNFVELGKRLLALDPDAVLVLTGGPAEADAAGELAQAIGSTDRVLNLAGKTSLTDLLTLYCLADVLVTNDSGPAHFASMTPVECVVLFGPEAPALYRPIGSQVHVIWAGLACSPCVNAFNHRVSPCNDNRCMSAITVDDVFEKVRSILEHRHRQPRPTLELRVLRKDQLTPVTHPAAVE